jgi:hypothetical protein
VTDLERAIAFATEAHRGQVDKLGEPYIDHCLRVMDAVSEPAKRVAVLHDVLEDRYPMNPTQGMEALEREVGLPFTEQLAVFVVTRFSKGAPDRTYANYIGFIAMFGGTAGDLAREVKVADLRDNLGRWVPELGTDLKVRYERALARLTEETT